MQKLFFLLGSVFLASNLSLAAGKHMGRTGASTSTETVSTAASETSLTSGFAMPILPDSGETGLGLAFGVLTQTEIAKRLYVGGDFGIHFWGKFEGLSNGDNSVTGLQLLPTAVYTLGSNPNWVPYFGLSAGPYLYLNGTKGTGTGTRVSFLMVFRPGVNWAIGKKVGLNGEAKFGSLDGSFIVIPTANLTIAL